MAITQKALSQRPKRKAKNAQEHRVRYHFDFSITCKKLRQEREQEEKSWGDRSDQGETGGTEERQSGSHWCPWQGRQLEAHSGRVCQALPAGRSTSFVPVLRGGGYVRQEHQRRFTSEMCGCPRAAAPRGRHCSRSGKSRRHSRHRRRRGRSSRSPRPRRCRRTSVRRRSGIWGAGSAAIPSVAAAAATSPAEGSFLPGSSRPWAAEGATSAAKTTQSRSPASSIPGLTSDVGREKSSAPSLAFAAVKQHQPPQQPPSPPRFVASLQSAVTKQRKRDDKQELKDPNPSN